ncbi:MAG TPA: hypothetical protein VN636_03250 [Acidimicrobiia bacterium]|nr:hypothetical protein [Acidimicrobiia bacterium]
MTALGPWEPFAVDTVAALLRATPARWWLSGGCAVDHFLGRVTRPHGDIDVSVARDDWVAFADSVDDRLEWFVARDGSLTPAAGARRAQLRPGEHNLWAREHGEPVWRLQVNLEPVSDGVWIYRRDARIRRPVGAVVLPVRGVPCVQPAVQLLWKAKDPRPIDDLDRANVEPVLSPGERSWLDEAIEIAHPDSPWCTRTRTRRDHGYCR